MPNLIVATVRGVDKKLGFIDQVAARILGVRLVRFPMGVKKIICEFPPGKWIPEFLRVVITRAKFADNLVRDYPRVADLQVLTSALAA